MKRKFVRERNKTSVIIQYENSLSLQVQRDLDLMQNTHCITLRNGENYTQIFFSKQLHKCTMWIAGGGRRQ